MPCYKPLHSHEPWPVSGNRQFSIESCETSCGWCKYATDRANNLRVHARRHIKEDPALSKLVIVPSKAGRRRVETDFQPNIEPSTGFPDAEEMPQQNDESEKTTLISQLEAMELREKLQDASGRNKLLALKVISLHSILKPLWDNVSSKPSSYAELPEDMKEHIQELQVACHLQLTDTTTFKPNDRDQLYELEGNTAKLKISAHDTQQAPSLQPSELLEALQTLQELSGKDINVSTYFPTSFELPQHNKRKARPSPDKQDGENMRDLRNKQSNLVANILN